MIAKVCPQHEVGGGLCTWKRKEKEVILTVSKCQHVLIVPYLPILQLSYAYVAEEEEGATLANDDL